MADHATLRHAALSVATAAVVAGMLVGGIVGDESWIAWGLSWIGFPLMGALILWQLPGHVLGWLLWLTGACWAAALMGYAYLSASAGWLEFLLEVASRLGFLMLVAIVILFPSGRAQTLATRILIRATAFVAACIVLTLVVGSAPLTETGWTSPLALPALGSVTAWFNNQGFVVVPLILFAALVSLLARWHNSGGVERLQYRWFALSVALAFVMMVATNTVFNYLDAPDIAFGIATAIGLNAVPVAIGVAVTRYRLYEIDRIVSRTTSYAAVTGLLLLVYATVVTAVTRVLPEGSSAFAVAAATLAAAALFRPLLRRVQTAVDHRFNRSGYDALRAADAFANRLRDEVDPDEVAADLAAVLRVTVQPARVGLWLRERAP